MISVNELLERYVKSLEPVGKDDESTAQKIALIKETLIPLFAYALDFMKLGCEEAEERIKTLKAKTGELLKGRTMWVYFCCLRGIFTWAEDNGLGKNRALMTGREKDFPASESSKRPKPTMSDARKLLTAFAGTDYEGQAIFAAKLGIGAEESAVIGWDDIKPLKGQDGSQPVKYGVTVYKRYSSVKGAAIELKKPRTVIVSGPTLNKILRMKKKATGRDGALKTKGPCIPAGKKHGPVCFTSKFMRDHGAAGITFDGVARMMRDSVLNRDTDYRGRRGYACTVDSGKKDGSHLIHVRKPVRGLALNKPKAPKDEDTPQLPPADAAPEKPDEAPEKEPDGQPDPEIQ